MKEDIKTTSLLWQQVAFMWKNYFTVPSRISNEEATKYKEWLAVLNENKKPLRALVLGATPELRDAATDLGYALYSIDINPDMFLAMDELLKNKNPKEVLVKENWLTNSLQSSYFDVILGDAVLPNVPRKDRLTLLAEVQRMLKRDGIFLTRAFCVPKKKRFKNVQEILDHFATKKQSVAQTALEIVLELQILAYDPKDHLGSFRKAKNLLDDYVKKNGTDFKSKTLNEAYPILSDFWCNKFVEKVFVYATRDEEETDYKKFFNIEETFEASDHEYSKITPMYFLRKSNK